MTNFRVKLRQPNVKTHSSLIKLGLEITLEKPSLPQQGRTPSPLVSREQGKEEAWTDTEAVLLKLETREQHWSQAYTPKQHRSQMLADQGQ